MQPLQSEHPDVRLARSEWAVLRLVDPPVQLEGRASHDPTVLHRHQDRGAIRTVRHAGDLLEVALPGSLPGPDELAVCLGRDPSCLDVFAPPRLAHLDLHPTEATGGSVRRPSG